MAKRPVKCPCEIPIADLRVVRTTSRPNGIERERRCEKGHRIFTIEVGRYRRKATRVDSRESANPSNFKP